MVEALTPETQAIPDKEPVMNDIAEAQKILDRREALVDRENKRELVLGPYVGAPTGHVRIPFGKGVCGQAAERKDTIIIQDVSKEDNYLSCSTEVQSEIVVPIFKDGELIGEIDIDSHEVASFSEDDISFLKGVAEMAARIM